MNGILFLQLSPTTRIYFFFLLPTMMMIGRLAVPTSQHKLNPPITTIWTVKLLKSQSPKNRIIESTEIHSNAFDSLSWLVTSFLFLTILNCHQIKSLFRLITNICFWQDTQVLHTYYFDEKKERKRSEREEREEKKEKGSTVKEWNGTKTSFSSDTPTRLLFCCFLFPPTFSIFPPTSSIFPPTSSIFPPTSIFLTSPFRSLSAKKRTVRISIEIYWFSGVCG